MAVPSFPAMRDFLRRTERRIDDLTAALRYTGDMQRDQTLALRELAQVLRESRDQFTTDIARLDGQIEQHIAALAGLAAALVKP